MIRPNEPLGDYNLNPPDDDTEHIFYRWACENADDIDAMITAKERLKRSYLAFFGESIGPGDIEQAARCIAAGGYAP